MKNWFPLGLAEGKAFCNRVKEREHLEYNITHSIHSLIVSPRRYGKTSLAHKVMTDIKITKP